MHFFKFTNSRYIEGPVVVVILRPYLVVISLGVIGVKLVLGVGDKDSTSCVCCCVAPICSRYWLCGDCNEYLL